MQFFEKPRLVTALVFFIQTIVALLHMETFIYLHIYNAFILPFFFGFPFAFYYVYKFILSDLDKTQEEAPKEPEKAVKAEEMKNHDKEAPSSPVKKQEKVLAVMKAIEEENEKKNRLLMPEKTEKHIQVIHANEVFTDEDQEPEESLEQTDLKPIVVKEAPSRRQKHKEQASTEAGNLREHKNTVETASPTTEHEPEPEKEA